MILLKSFSKLAFKACYYIGEEIENRHGFLPFFALCVTNFYLYSSCGSSQRVKYLFDTLKENLVKSQILSFLFKNMPNKIREDWF